MKIVKRCLTIVVALILVLSMCINSGATKVFASGTSYGATTETLSDETRDPEEQVEQSIVETVQMPNDTTLLDMDAVAHVVSLFEKLPSSSELKNITSEEINDVMQQTVEAINAFDALSLEESEYIINNYSELYNAVMKDLSDYLTEKQQGEIATMSLLPLEEQTVYLILSDYTEQELKNMSIDTILSLLEDSEGNTINISPDANKAWVYSINGDTDIEEYTSYNLGKNEEIDLSQFYGGDEETFQLEIIVGNGGQLNQENIRYIITVHLTDEIEIDINDLTPSMYAEYTGFGREYIAPGSLDRSSDNDAIYNENTGEYVPLWSFGYALNQVVTCNRALLFFDSEIVKDPRVSVKIEDCQDNLKDITDQILNQDKNDFESGYEFREDVNLFYVTYYKDNEILEEVYVAILVAGGYMKYETTMSSLIDGQKTDVIYDTTETYRTVLRNDENQVIGDCHNYTFELKQGNSAQNEYLFGFSVFGGRGAQDNWNHYIEKAVVGHYTSIDETTNLPDIKEELFGDGYSGNYSGEGIDFTIFFGNGYPESMQFSQISVKNIDYSINWREFTDKPIIGEADPWFRVQGAESSDGEKYDTYVVENGKNINMDTYYGYGYQTIFINDANADLSSIKPDFWYANTDRVYAVSKDTGNRVDENHIRDFTEENQQYTGVIIDEDGQENERNYWVTFKKLNNNGPELYVFGPREREVILDEYFEFKHDILIANIGNAPLEDISVELLDAKNVKLDPYWTVGGDGNDTLAAFTTTSTNTDYGELANMAKIRLLPDGDGQVEGTLIIRAKGQEPVMITLNGTAQNPEIITETLSDAVKYVPYQQIVATNNMHDWVETKFSIVDGSGTLPEGITLNSETGEIYGVPTVPYGSSETTYSFTVEVKYLVDGEEGYFDPSYKDFELVVKPNTDENVYLASDSDDGYSIKQPIGTQTGDYSFELNEIADTEFTSNGEYGEFVGLWLNGELLDPGVDYDSESGSTKITIKSQTFENRADKDGTNTIAMEFRKDTDGDGKGDSGAEMNRTAQNFTINEKPTQAEIDKAAANRVISLIGSIPSTVTLDDREIINDARTAYNELTSAQQALVTNYDRLNRAEAAIKQLEENAKDKAAADKVVSMIDALPNPITLDSRNAVNAARNAYNMLTASQKGYVTNYTRLQDAENKIIALEKEAGNTESITFVGILVDKNGKACEDKIVEIHSLVQTSRTDENGSFQFNSVEFGQHIIYVKDVNENVLAQKEFNIKLGSPVALNGNDIIAENGSVFTVKMQLDGNELTFLNIEEGNKAPVIDIKQYSNSIDIGDDGKIQNIGRTNPQTGDRADLPVWYALLIASLSILIMTVCVNIKKGKRFVNTGDKKGKISL